MISLHLTDEQIDAYVDQGLADDEVAIIEAHLAVCAGCRHAVQDWRMMLTGLTSLPSEPLRHDLSGPVMARIQASAWRRSPLLTGGLISLQLAITLVLAIQLAPLLPTALAPVGEGLTGLAVSWPGREGSDQLSWPAWLPGLSAISGLSLALTDGWPAMPAARLSLEQWGWLSAAAGLLWLTGNRLMLRGRGGRPA